MTLLPFPRFADSRPSIPCLDQSQSCLISDEQHALGYNPLRQFTRTPYQDFRLSMTQELEAQALAILDSLVSVPFEQCIPITRSFKNVTANATIYAVRHREFGQTTK